VSHENAQHRLVRDAFGNAMYTHMGSASADKGPNRYRKRNSKKVFPSNVVSANGWYKFIVGFEDYVMHHLMTLKG